MPEKQLGHFFNTLYYFSNYATFTNTSRYFKLDEEAADTQLGRLTPLH